MATLISAADGNWNTAATWLVANSTAELDSEANQVAVGTGNTDSGTFTPGAITVDAIALRPRSKLGSTGTFTVTLRNSTDAVNVVSVTVNVSDFPSTVTSSNSSTIVNGGWMLFAFSPQLLVAGKAYLIRVTSSSAAQVTLWGSTATNMSRLLRTTTAPGAAPAASDKLVGAGEWTAAGTMAARALTYDNTANTTYGTANAYSIYISQGCTLTAATSAATAYVFKTAGFFHVGPGATVNIGTSGTPMPSSSTFILDFIVSTNGDAGLLVWGGTFNCHGATKTTITTITSTAAAAQAVVNVADVTGWANGDEIALSPTRRVVTQGEHRTILSIATLAVTCTVNFTNAHDGSSSALAPNNPRGHVGVLTHNVKIRGVSTALQATVQVFNGSTFNARYTEFKFLGVSSGYGRAGVFVEPSVTSFDMQYCSFWSSLTIGGSTTANFNNTIVAHNVCYSMATNAVAISFTGLTSNTNWSITDNLYIGPSAGSTTGIQVGIPCGDVSRNIITGAGTAGITLGSTFNSANTLRPIGTIEDNEVYCSAAGWIISGILPQDQVISGAVSWRNTAYGFRFSLSQNRLYLDDCVLFGSATVNLYLNADLFSHLGVRRLIADGETSFASQWGVVFNGVFADLDFEECEFSQNVVHTVFDFAWDFNPVIHARFNNCLFGAGNQFDASIGANAVTPMIGTRIGVTSEDQTPGLDYTVNKFGRIVRDETIYDTAAPSERVYAQDSASYKQFSTRKIVKCNAGQAVTVSVRARKSAIGDGAAYNGNQPRLIQVRNPALGFATEVTLDTMTAAVGNWETLTATTGTATEDGAIAFYIDLDGTAGWVNVDTWSFSVA
jgi:hypothetical protein